MTTECNAREFDFQAWGSRAVTARFDGGAITSDAGGLLLREVEAKTGIFRRFAACFTDHRDPERVEHTVPELMAQRIFALALGYEDLNDHDALRHDPLLAVLVGKADPTGQDRRRREDRGKSLAGKSTLNRLELTPVGADQKSRYKKVVARHRDIENFFVEMFLSLHPTPPKEIVLDFDATDDPIHGHQLGRFFHGYCDGYCYLPLYVFCGEHLLCAKLRPADIDGAAGSVKQLARLVEHIRRQWPKEQQLCLFADRTSCATMRANQLRLWLSSAAYTLLAALRQFGLQGTEMAQSRCDTIRLKLLKLGALVRTTVRRVWISFSESCPYQRVFAQVYENLRRWSLPSLASG
jgi:hypothetical protein